MHVRAATGQIQPGKMQETINIYNNSVSVVKAQKGYQGAYLMTDAASGKILYITFWESEADMLAGESIGGYYQQEVGRLGLLCDGTYHF